MRRSPLIALVTGALLIGSAGAAFAHTAIGPDASQRNVAADECGAQGDQEGDHEDAACATDQPSEDAKGSNEQGDTGDKEHGASGSNEMNGATGAKGEQPGAGGNEQGQHGTDGEQDGDHSD